MENIYAITESQRESVKKSIAKYPWEDIDPLIKFLNSLPKIKMNDSGDPKKEDGNGEPGE